MLNIDGPPENSSDLERAPGARSIGEEFSGGPSIVHHLQQCENARFSHSCCTFWDPESPPRAELAACRSGAFLNAHDVGVRPFDRLDTGSREARSRGGGPRED